MERDLLEENDYTEGYWILLMALKKLGKIFTKTKLQKLIFLVQEEAQIKGGYDDFSKHHYGPHSYHLTADAELLSQEGLIIKEQTLGCNNRPYYFYQSTENGNKLLEESICPKVDKNLIEKVKSIVDKYGNCEYKELTEYVYKKYLPKPEKYEERLEELMVNIKILENLWEDQYSVDSIIYVDLMSTMEYITLIFDKINKIHLDLVVKGVVLVTSEDLIENSFEISELYFGDQNYDESLKQLNDLFDFLSYYSDKKELVPALEKIDFNEIFSEEEIERLEQQQIAPTQQTY